MKKVTPWKALLYSFIGVFVVIILIYAMYLEIFQIDPQRYLPEKFVMGAGLSSAEFELSDDGTLTLGIINNIGAPITITKIEVESQPTSDIECSIAQDFEREYGFGKEVALTKKYNFSGVCFGEPGEKLKADVSVTFIKEGETEPRIASGELKVIVKELYARMEA